MVSRTPWNKGLTKELDKRVMAASYKLSKSHIGKINPHTKKLNFGIINIETAYIIGCLCSDASILSKESHNRIVSGSIRLVCKDNDYAIAFKNCLDKSFKDSFFRENKNKKMYYVGIASTSLVIEIVKKWGFFRTKTWSIPKEIKSSTNEIKYYFLRGLFDGDGSVNKLGHIRIQKINKKGLNEVYNLLKKIGIKSHFRFCKNTSKGNPIYEINICDLENRKLFLTRIGFEIKRKLNRLKDSIDG